MAEQTKRAAKKALPSDPKARFKAQADIRLPKAVAALDSIGAMASKENYVSKAQVEFISKLLTEHFQGALTKLAARAEGKSVVAGVPTIVMPD